MTLLCVVQVHIALAQWCRWGHAFSTFFLLHVKGLGVKTREVTVSCCDYGTGAQGVRAVLQMEAYLYLVLSYYFM